MLEIVVSSQPRIACRRSSARRPFEKMTRTVTESQGLHDDDECTSIKKTEVNHDGRSSIFRRPVASAPTLSSPRGGGKYEHRPWSGGKTKHDAPPPLSPPPPPPPR